MYDVWPGVHESVEASFTVPYDNPDALFDQLAYEVECGDLASDDQLRASHYLAATELFRALDMCIVRTGRVPGRWRTAVELGGSTTSSPT